MLFDYSVFYNAIVRWFEDTDNAEEQAFIDDVLLLWNWGVPSPLKNTNVIQSTFSERFLVGKLFLTTSHRLQKRHWLRPHLRGAILTMQWHNWGQMIGQWHKQRQVGG